jgi:hypothetical protein
MIVHVDNVGPHVAKCVTKYMEHSLLKIVPRPPYSPDLAASTLSTFIYVKDELQKHEFPEGAWFVWAISAILNQIPIDTLVDVCDDLMRRF